MIIEGTITRDIGGRPVPFPCYIDAGNGTYAQWGHDTVTLGENVDLLESLRNAACGID